VLKNILRRRIWATDYVGPCIADSAGVIGSFMSVCLSCISVHQHAHRDIVIPFPSVCLSVCHVEVLYLNEWTFRHSF